MAALKHEKGLYDGERFYNKHSTIQHSAVDECSSITLADYGCSEEANSQALTS
ncbi:hypothetical protein EYZ11_005827 [Aspergillus tanneri]|uniref:Uncharacterized protein n=1 Tax=Aspergillus tanneri TaxID=1220188 RepID=A0A4S3JH92_9EURO|nr:uncharacterized protein ATNIH1004_003575 [Aspergillus tanneri]KAA8650886.1 hypothetical protein ATNIH1004_003575 [Aspergillus tanneri]THC94682.1 hypothetical protein EYZ11_005827 [Aspergillus tanneri]